MITTVYVPLDGSEVADGAIAPALELARRAGAELALLAARWPDARESTMRNYLDARAAFVDGPVDACVIADQAPAEAIVEAGAEPGALVCMATRGRGALRAALLGSVAEAVVRSARGATVLVGPAHDQSWNVPEHPSILVGVDGSDGARSAALAAALVASAIGASVELAAVLVPAGDGRGRHEDDTLADLSTLATEVRERGVHATTTPLDGFDTAPLLDLHARERGSTLLALGSHGRSGVSRVALGSVAFATIRRSARPVLLTGPCWAEHP